MKIENAIQLDIRQQLEKSAAELQELLHDHLQTDRVDGGVQQGGNDSGDDGLQMADIEMEMTNTSRTGYQLELTRNALKKLDANTFGECEDCAEQIGVKRLLANPIAKRCIDCQTKRENSQTQKDVTPSL